VNHCFQEPALDPDAFPGVSPVPYGESWYWSSTVGTSPIEERRWSVGMEFGGTNTVEIEYYDNLFLRCVRDP
jgi:hypothetical protein